MTVETVDDPEHGRVVGLPMAAGGGHASGRRRFRA
jgi:hypothetical protein